MKSKILLVIFAVLLFAVIAICVCLLFRENDSVYREEETVSNGVDLDKKDPEFKKAEVIANGVHLLTQEALISKEHAVLPLFEVLQSFGTVIEWTNDKEAEITHNDVNMHLSLSDMSLMIDHVGVNFLSSPFGSEYYCCEYVNGEIMIDECTISEILCRLNIKSTIDLHYEDAKIVVSYR